MDVEIGVIGGSGVYSVKALEDTNRVEVDTPYGKSPEIVTGSLKGKRVAFLPRHGRGHGLPPSKVNYRANIWSLNELGADRVLATTAVGSLSPDMEPGDFVILDQFLDFTKKRNYTFFEGGDEGVVHVDMTDPYCPELRNLLTETTTELGIPFHSEGTYASTEGPRFETRAEIQMLDQVGGDVVGMTNVPECVLAREMEMCYSTVSVVTNFAAGISDDKLTHDEVAEIMERNIEQVKELFFAVIPTIPEERSCPCKDALTGARVTVD